MELVKQSVKIEQPHELVFDSDYGIELLQHIENAGRTCYKSEGKNPECNVEKTKKFVGGIIKRGHHSVIEHCNITVRFITNRGCTHELVRHRLAAYSQESTRYCNYGNDHVKFIIPPWGEDLEEGIYEFDFENFKRTGEVTWTIPNNNKERGLGLIKKSQGTWMRAMLLSEYMYQQLIKEGLSPQFARGVLPIDLKTEIVTTCNLREWRHIFSLRCAKAAHPQIRELMLGLLGKFYTFIPVIFDDLYEEYIDSEKEDK
jgi:thymidylate synthase (FAD)